jgi:hypothetical protein
MFSPGIIEYLSGSSALSAIVLNPVWFPIGLAANLGLYGPGVLLIREAVIRWNKGWWTVLVLGSAYGILEEGVALNTMFNPTASVVGSLGVYGHYLGVNTVWVPGIIMVHAVFSIAIPILLLGLALPETRGQSLLNPRQIRQAFAILTIDVALLFLFNLLGLHFFMGWALLLGSLAVIAVLVFIAYRVPFPENEPLPARPFARSLWIPAAAGVFLFFGTIGAQGISESLGFPPAIAIAGASAVVLGLGVFAHRYLRGPEAYRARLAFVFGVLAPILLFGFFTNFPFEFVLVGDAGLVLLFRHLFRQAPVPALVPVVAGGHPGLTAPSPA